ncbi:hypothetical protein LCGC14_0948700 [marine sediment metagenome]|uniref:Uncharacterized protein n=1 Tax=marine sediment metagenome TaxID=412755 RepID=A0A0F9P414_9ZZZZ
MQVTKENWQELQLTLQQIEFAAKAQAKETKRLADHTQKQNGRISDLEHDAIKQATVIGILKWLIPVGMTTFVGMGGIIVAITELVL